MLKGLAREVVLLPFARVVIRDSNLGKTARLVRVGVRVDSAELLIARRAALAVPERSMAGMFRTVELHWMVLFVVAGGRCLAMAWGRRTVDC